MTRPGILVLVALLALNGFSITPALGEEGSTVSEVQDITWSSPLVIVQCLWILLVTVGAVVYSGCIGKIYGGKIEDADLRGLNLPRGSLRGILALLTIGSFVNVMVLGAPFLGEHFENVLTAFGTLTGSIVGFYFGTRGATPPTKKLGVTIDDKEN